MAPYTPAVGPLETVSIGGVKLERGSDRPLELRVTFPKSGGPYPVIVHSHGMYGSGDGVRPLTDAFARHGYVVVAPTHGDSMRYADAETRRRALGGSLDNTKSWDERPKEVSLIIDRLAELEDKVEGLKGKVDTTKVGVGGHSFGAWTTQVVSGMTLGRGAISMSDPRPIAFLVISPSGIGGGVTKESFAAMRGPMLMVSGDNDRGRFEGDPGDYRRQAFQHATPGDKTLVWIKDADHGFGGINGRSGARLSAGRLGGRSNPRHVDIVHQASLAFWDSTLRGDARAKAWLASDAISGQGDVTVSRK